MNNQFGLVFKVFSLSVLISVLIKYAAPTLPIPETGTNALILILSPTAIVAILLGMKFWKLGSGN